MALTPAGEAAKQQIIALANLLRTDDKLDHEAPLKYYPEVIHQRKQRLSNQIDTCAEAIVAGLIEALSPHRQAETDTAPNVEQKRGCVEQPVRAQSD